ncbi:CUGBP Elav-like family member 5 [Liparis tanakae]|uniref:CUGBP Elav-like family member 5 n=1 Tax=Liparis tanakae TaxID=230148 RepID=A0A4Z2GUM1_9TELE|nr:CUGBP Elav-like family member 5 [Liparis tanakae]
MDEMPAPGILQRDSHFQLMQQQAAIMAASHGGYLTPSVAFPATQIHQMGALNINSLQPNTMTQVSGDFHQALDQRRRKLQDSQTKHEHEPK